MTVHTATFTDVTGSGGGAHVNVNPGDVKVFSWDTSTLVNWPGSTSANGPIFAGTSPFMTLLTDVGAIHEPEPVTDPTKTILIELLVNATIVASNTQGYASTPGRTFLSWAQVVTPGDTASVRITVSSACPGGVRIDDGSTERGGIFPAQYLKAGETNALSTTASLDDDGNIQDSAVLIGQTSPTGTIIFDLFDSSDLECSGTPIYTETVTVSGNGTYTTVTGYTPTIPGLYHWRATYSGDENNDPTSTACDDEEEQITIAGLSNTIIVCLVGAT